MDVANAKGLFVQRGWEVDLVRRTHQLLAREGLLSDPTKDVVLDVGANIGMICIAMLRWGYFRKALAFEPFPDHFSLLERNIKQNGMENAIRAFPYALSAGSGEAMLETSDSNAGDQRVRASAPRIDALMSEESRGTLPIQTRALDSILGTEAALDPKRIGLIWLDIQGHEGHFFEGARATLSHGVPVLTEFWPYGILRSGLSAGEYTAIMRSLFSSLIVVVPETASFERVGPDSILDLFKDYPRPEDQLEILLLPKARL